MSRNRWLTALTLLTLATACGGGGDGVPVQPAQPTAPPAVASITVTLGAAQLEVGATTTAAAEARSAAGAVLSGRAVTWNSSNASVAVVSGTGAVTALSPGSTNIIASIEGQSGSAVLVVVPVPVASVSVTLAQSTISVGGTTAATATLRSAGGSVLADRTVTWSSSNTDVATVTSGGVITALAPGATTITATSEGRSGSATLTVTPIPVATVTVSLGLPTVTVGTTTSATAAILGPAGEPLTGRSISWSSSNTGVATISAAGLITPIAPGTTTITATSEGRSGSASLIVIAPPVASIVVTLGARSLQVGQSTSAQAATRDAAGNVLVGRSIVWSSSNTAVATVSQSGTVSAVSPGTAEIRATSEGQTGVASLQVTSAGAASVTLAPSAVSMLVGDSRIVIATVRDASGAVLAGRNVQWFTSDRSIVDGAIRGDTAVITGLRPGSAVVSAEVDGRRASTTVVVEAATVNVCAVIAGASIFGNDGRYLGRFTNRFDSESVLNEFGQFGSRFAANSTNNEFGTYGSPFSSLSARNPFTSTPPRIVRNNVVLAFYTVNETLSPRVSPNFALTCNFP